MTAVRVPCDGTELVLDRAADAAGRPRLRLSVVLNPHAGGYLRLTAAALTPQAARELAAAIDTLLREETADA